MRKILPVILVLLSACASTPTSELIPTVGPLLLSPEDNLYAPKQGDANLKKASLVINSVNLSQDTESGRTIVLINGSLPTPCHDLRVEVKRPNINYEVHLKIYSVVRPSLTCDNVLRGFDARIMLGIYSSGSYSLWIGDQKVGDFVAY